MRGKLRLLAAQLGRLLNKKLVRLSAAYVQPVQLILDHLSHRYIRSESLQIEGALSFTIVGDEEAGMHLHLGGPQEEGVLGPQGEAAQARPCLLVRNEFNFMDVIADVYHIKRAFETPVRQQADTELTLKAIRSPPSATTPPASVSTPSEAAASSR